MPLRKFGDLSIGHQEGTPRYRDRYPVLSRLGSNEKDHHERKDEPMKLTTTTLVSVDGAAP
jgi:hypothetical protein